MMLKDSALGELDEKKSVRRCGRLPDMDEK